MRPVRRPRAVFLASLLALISACWLVVRAQQAPPAAAAEGVRAATPIDPAEVGGAALSVSKRAEHLKPMFDEVHPAEWIAKGAPEAYVAQWKSLEEQNDAVQTEMTSLAQLAESNQSGTLQNSALEPTLSALFRLHRFDSDLADLLKAERRYQNPALADLIESVAAGDQSAVEKIQQFALDLSREKDKQFAIVDQEAQRCRSMLANQPVARPAAARKPTAGNSK